MKIVNAGYVHPANRPGTCVSFADGGYQVLLSKNDVTKAVRLYAKVHNDRASVIRGDYGLLHSAMRTYIERRLVQHWRKWFGTNNVG